MEKGIASERREEGELKGTLAALFLALLFPSPILGELRQQERVGQISLNLTFEGATYKFVVASNINYRTVKAIIFNLSLVFL